MNLAELIPLSHIILDAVAGDKRALFTKAADCFTATQSLNRNLIIEALESREVLGSTGLGAGVAISHGRLKKLSEPLALFMRLSEAMEFNAPDAQPVRLIFVLLVPEKSTELHLQILSQMAAFFAKPQQREALLNATSQEAVQAYLRSPLAHAA